MSANSAEFNKRIIDAIAKHQAEFDTLSDFLQSIDFKKAFQGDAFVQLIQRVITPEFLGQHASQDISVLHGLNDQCMKFIFERHSQAFREIKRINAESGEKRSRGAVSYEDIPVILGVALDLVEEQGWAELKAKCVDLDMLATAQTNTHENIVTHFIHEIDNCLNGLHTHNDE